MVIVCRSGFAPKGLKGSGAMKLVALVLIFIAAVAGALFWRYSRDADKRRGQDVSERLDRAVQRGQSVRAEALADFEFDRLVVAYGRNSAKDIKAALGFDWRRADDEGYHCCDPPPLWMFVEGDEVVAYFRPSLHAGYGSCVKSGRTYPAHSRLPLRRCGPIS
jgi:hypothetical protein